MVQWLDGRRRRRRRRGCVLLGSLFWWHAAGELLPWTAAMMMGSDSCGSRRPAVWIGAESHHPSFHQFLFSIDFRPNVVVFPWISVSAPQSRYYRRLGLEPWVCLIGNGRSIDLANANKCRAYCVLGAVRASRDATIRRRETNNKRLHFPDYPTHVFHTKTRSRDGMQPRAMKARLTPLTGRLLCY